METGMIFSKKPELPSYIYAAIAGVVLAAVFTAYLQPDFLVLLANQIWLCF
jgi:uncharacterized membrane protein YdfJ with MMPL/SSD domain